MLRTIRFALLAALVISASALSTATRAAELKGKFIFDGEAPARVAVTDPKVASDFPGQDIKFEDLVVDPATKGISYIAVWVLTPDVAITPEAEKAAAEKPEVTLDNKNGRFEPHMMSFWLDKQKFFVKNSDPVGHNANFILAEQNPSLQPGGSPVEIAIPKVATVPTTINCGIHPWMKALVVIRKHPYVGISGTDGSFSIKNLPTGTELEFQVWHEKAGYLAAKPDWGTLKKAKFALTLNGDVDLGEIKVDPKLFEK